MADELTIEAARDVSVAGFLDTDGELSIEIGSDSSDYSEGYGQTWLNRKQCEELVAHILQVLEENP